MQVRHRQADRDTNADVVVERGGDSSRARRGDKAIHAHPRGDCVEVEAAGTALARHESIKLQLEERQDARTAALSIHQKLKQLEDRRRQREWVAAAEIARAGVHIRFGDGSGGTPKALASVVTEEDSAEAKEILQAAASGSSDGDTEDEEDSVFTRYARLHPASKYAGTELHSTARRTTGTANASQRGSGRERGGGVEGGGGRGGARMSPPRRTIFDRYIAAHPASRYLAPT